MHRQIALGLAGFMVLAGCYNAHGVRPSELPRLDGYPGREVEVADFSGRPVAFDGKTRLYLYQGNGERVGGRFAEITVVGGRFVGKTDDGKQIDLALGAVQEVSVDTYSRGQTIAAIVVGSLLVVAGIVIALAVSFDQPGYCGRNICPQ